MPLPKTLSALIHQADVATPLIEPLDIPAEPDGSATDDFVVPESFRERQNRWRPPQKTDEPSGPPAAVSGSCNA